jgi:hypothetical protein
MSGRSGDWLRGIQAVIPKSLAQMRHRYAMEKISKRDLAKQLGVSRGDGGPGVGGGAAADV